MAMLSPLEWLSDEFGWDVEWKREYSRSYRAYFNITDDAFAVRTSLATELNVTPLSLHPEDRGARVTKIAGTMQTSEQTTHPTLGVACFAWLIKIDYGYVSPLQVTETGNPLDKPATFVFEPEDDTEIVSVDVNLDPDGNGTPILNSAGLRYDPPVERLTGKGVITVSRNEPASFDFPTAFSNCYYRLNEAIWNGFAIGAILSKPLRLPEIQFSQEANVWYYPMQYQFFYDPDGWKKSVLDQSYEELDPSDSTKTRLILGADGHPASTPTLLDGEGHKLGPNPTPEQIKFFTYDVYKSIDYGAFNMNTLFTLPALD